MNVMRDVRGDPGATRYFEAEHIRACLAPGVPNPFFNQVFVGGPAHEGDLETALASFEQCSMTPRLEIGPGALSSELARQLAVRGFIPTLAEPMLIHGRRAVDEHLGSDVQTQRVESGEALEVFKTTYV